MGKTRNINIQPRVSNTRDSKQSHAISFNLDEIKKHYQENLSVINNLFQVANNLIDSNNIEEAKNIWRSQIVFLNSAFDFYLHEVIKYGIYKIYSGKWNKTYKYKKIAIPIETVENIIKTPEDADEYILDGINKVYEFITLMNYKKIEEHLKTINIEIGYIAKKAYPDNPNRLEEIIKDLFKRRNLIAHQSDRLHTNAEKEEVCEKDVKDFIHEIEKIVNTISKKLESKDKKTR